MPINTTCASCLHDINAPEEYAGRIVKCPRCKESVEIPAHPEQETSVTLSPPEPWTRAQSKPAHADREALIYRATIVDIDISWNRMFEIIWKIMVVWVICWIPFGLLFWILSLADRSGDF